MKILYIIPYNFIPPDTGNKNLIYALLKGISSQIECTLVILTDPLKKNIVDVIKKEFPFIESILLFSKPKGISLQLYRLQFILTGNHPALGRYKNKALKNWLKINAKYYDIIHYDMIHVAQYRKYCGNIPSLLVASDAYSLAARRSRLAGELSFSSRLSLYIQQWWLHNYEIKNYNLFNIVCTVSEVDALWLKQHSPKANIRIIGIGLASDYSDRPVKHFTNCCDNKVRILCTGNLNHKVIAADIIEFLEYSVLKLLSEQPNLEFIILGKNPAPELLKCVNKFSNRVIHLDFVKDYADFLDQDWIYVYPQRCGTGLQTKVQQAMALGLPVVGFQVSFGGLGVENGRHCIIVRNMDDMNNSIVQLLRSPTLRNKMGLIASYYIRDSFSLKKISDEMISLYKELNHYK